MIEAAISLEEQTMTPRQKSNISMLPENATVFLPASMRQLVDIGLKTTQAHQDNLVLGLLSFIVPLACGARICSSSEDERGETVRIYILVMGPSGVGKTIVITIFVPALLYDLESQIADTNKELKVRKQEIETKLKSLGRAKEDQLSRNKLETELTDIQLSHKTYLIEGATAEGLFRALEHGSTPLVVLDEFGALLKRAERSEHTRGFVDMLTQIADRGSAKGRIIKGDDPPALLNNLSLSIFAATTPEDLQRDTALSLLRGGHLARYTISYVTEARPLPDRDYLTRDEIEAVKTWGIAIRTAAQKHEGRFELSQGAERYLREYKQTISQQFVEAVNSGEPDGGAIVRLVRQAKSFSLLLHLGGEKTRKDEKISRETMAQACGLTSYYFTSHHQRLMDYLEHGEDQARRMNISERILRYLQKNGGRLKQRQIYKHLHLKKDVTYEVLKFMEAQKSVRIEDGGAIVCL